jgi:hypothetical protein
MTMYQTPASQPQAGLGSGETMPVPGSGGEMMGMPVASGEMSGMEAYAKMEDGPAGDAARYFWEHQGEDHDATQ